MPLLKTLAIVLKSRRWGEADRIVTLYTDRLGKIRGVARGVRRSKSRFAGSLEPFVLCHVDLFEKPGDTLYRISQVDLVESFSRLREDLALMAAAARMANVASAVTPDGEPEPCLFETLVSGLRALQGSSDPPLTTLLFEIRLLGQTGFRPQTDHCASCGTTHLLDEPVFSPTAGGLVCGRCASRQPGRSVVLSKGSLAFLHQAVRFPETLVTRLKAEGRVRVELESAIEAYMAIVAGKHLPAVDFLAGDGRTWHTSATTDRPAIQPEGTTRP